MDRPVNKLLQEVLTAALASEWTPKQALILERTENVESVVDAVQRVASHLPQVRDLSSKLQWAGPQCSLLLFRPYFFCHSNCHGKCHATLPSVHQPKHCMSMQCDCVDHSLLRVSRFLTGCNILVALPCSGWSAISFCDMAPLG